MNSATGRVHNMRVVHISSVDAALSIHLCEFARNYRGAAAGSGRFEIFKNPFLAEFREIPPPGGYLAAIFKRAIYICCAQVRPPRPYKCIMHKQLPLLKMQATRRGARARG